MCLSVLIDGHILRLDLFGNRQDRIGHPGGPRRLVEPTATVGDVPFRSWVRGPTSTCPPGGRERRASLPIAVRLPDTLELPHTWEGRRSVDKKSMYSVGA